MLRIECKRSMIFLRQFLNNICIRLANELLDNVVVKPFDEEVAPMFFIHMIGRTDGIIAFSQFTSHIGLHVNGNVRLVCFEPDEHEPFAMYADGKHGFDKQILGNFGVK